jgi:N-acetylglucosaminyl-diphospho-decaprenol L-rhamnosyltransferase
MKPRVSVVVANYNGAHLLPECLSSLSAQDVAPIEIVVVDNGSVDGSAAVARTHGCRFVALGANLGLTAAYNRGAAAASGEYVFFVNNDMRFEPDCVARLVEILDGRPDVFAADPLQFNWEGDRVIHRRPELRRIHSARELITSTILPVPPLRMNYTAACTEATDVPWGCAGCLLVRRQMFDALGGWDETFFIDMEDLDLCWRAWQRGWPTVFVPGAHLYHRVGASNGATIRFRRLVSQQRNHLCFALKVLDLRSVAALLLLKVALLPLYAVRRPLVGLALARALGRFVVEFPATWAQRRQLSASARWSSRELITRFMALSQA